MLRLGTIRGLAILGLALLIPACGGGGGGGGAVPDSVQFSAATYSVSETAASTTITVTRTGGAGAVTVNFATSNGSAAAGADYNATTGTLSWAAGDATPKQFNVDLQPADTTVEGDETVLLTLSLVSGGAILGTQKTATLTLTDVDAPADGVFQFSAATYTVSEGAGATVQATITVTRTGGSGGAVIANVAVTGGTAAAGTDFTDPGVVVLNWADGDAASKQFTIDILDAATAGGSQTVNLALTAPVQLPQVPQVGTVGTAVLTIINRDVPGTVRLSTATDSVFESGGLATITVSRIDGSGGAASVEANVTAGTAVAGTDYTIPVPNPVVLNWADGDFADKSFTIAILDDAVIDGNKTVNVMLQNPGGVATSAPAAELLTLLDDEPGTLNFTLLAFPATPQNEGNAGTTTLTISVSRTGGSLGLASVEVVDAGTGTATSGNDYVAIPTTALNWGNGDSADKTFNITINGDANVEPDETIDLLLQNATGAVIGLQNAATATITNDDVPANGTFQYDVPSMTGVEGGTANIVINRVGGSTGTVTVTLTTSNGTAKSNGNPANRDFTAKTEVITFLAGELTKTFTVLLSTLPTGVTEGTEFFNVTMSAPTGGATIDANSVGPKPVAITE